MANITWKKATPSDVAITTNPADEFLAAFNTLVTANAADATFLWEVVSYVSTSPRSLLLRRKDLSAGRILLFGQQGSTPNAAATRNTPLASALYIGYSPSSTVNVVDASYLVGAPLAAADYMAGVTVLTTAFNSSTSRISYMDTASGLVFLVYQTSNGATWGGAGELVVSTSGTDLSCNFGGGTSAATGPFTGTTGAGTLINPAVGTNTYTSSDAGIVVRISGSNQLCYRLFSVISATGLGQLLNLSATKGYFFPIVLTGNSVDLTYNVVGKLKQIGFGPISNRDTTFTDGTTAGTAYNFFHTSAGASTSGPWFTNTEI